MVASLRHGQMMTEYVDGVVSGTERIAENTELAQGDRAAFFAANKDGITHVDYETRTYYVRRGWTLKGPIPKGTRIEHVGAANTRRVGKVKRKRS